MTVGRASVIPEPLLGGDLCTDTEAALRREWLVTNGLGGYASGTVAGAQTRRYHGLLVAARKPPVGRTVLLVDLDVRASVDGQSHELACHEYADGTVHPAGHRLIESFTLEGTVPTWRYALGAARLTRRVFMARGRNTTYVVLTLEHSPSPVHLRIRPLCTGRDYHWHRRGRDGYRSEALPRGCRVEVGGDLEPLRIESSDGVFIGAEDTHWNLWHRAEADRGLDATEDLFTPGEFEVTLVPGGQVTIVAQLENGAAAEGTPTAAAALAAIRSHESTLLENLPADAPDWIRRLTLAADQFLVARPSASGAGATVIAGYPWFSDWGRDTMIALPGLTLATGRRAVAAQILRTFAAHVDQGLLPNRFPDQGERAEYNTVDATLWYFVAVDAYWRASGDVDFVRELFPVLADIVAWHRRGTRHGIGVDPADGLLRAGEPGVQLTWMDAKVGDWVVTPRMGKPVEINALWCNSLAILADLGDVIGAAAEANTLRAAATAAQTAFAQRFWSDELGHLYDVIDTPVGDGLDRTLRPNQLIALSLPHALLAPARARAVLAACERALLTPLGLRTLAPGSDGYAPRYGGSPLARDAAYHQGTVWPWLLGPFVRAHLAVHDDPRSAGAYLDALVWHLRDAGLGQISEVFDADPPHRPGGCIAQAWSVAEILDTWKLLHTRGRSRP